VPDIPDDIHLRPIPPPAPAPDTSPQPPTLFDDSALYGLAGEFVRTVAPHTEAHPLALLTQFLVAFGNVVGRGPHVLAEADEHHGNLFVVLVGASSRGRKGSSWGHIRRLFERVDAGWADARVASGLSSGEGLIHQVRDERTNKTPIKAKGLVTGYQDEIVDEGVADKRLLVVEGEFAAALKMLRRKGNTLSPMVRCAFDSGTLRSLTKNSPERATLAHISIVGHITKTEVLRYLDETECGNGFANRLLWVWVRRSQLLPEGGQLDVAALDPLADRIRKAVAFARDVERVTFDETAQELWRDAYPCLTREVLGLLGAITARSEALCVRLALLYALLDRSSVIRIEHLHAAFVLWSYCEDSARFVFGEALGHGLADEILTLLRNHPEGLPLKGIHDHFSRNRKAAHIREALDSLQRSGLAQVEPTPTGGRPAQIWRATNKTKKTNEGADGGALASFRSFLSSLPPHRRDETDDRTPGVGS